MIVKTHSTSISGIELNNEIIKIVRSFGFNSFKVDGSFEKESSLLDGTALENKSWSFVDLTPSKANK